MDSKRILKYVILLVALAGVGYIAYVYAWPWIKSKLPKSRTLTGVPQQPGSDGQSVYYGTYGEWTIWWDNTHHYWAQQDGVTPEQSMEGIGVTPSRASLNETLTDIDSGSYALP